MGFRTRVADWKQGWLLAIQGSRLNRVCHRIAEQCSYKVYLFAACLTAMTMPWNKVFEVAVSSVRSLAANAMACISRIQ